MAIDAMSLSSGLLDCGPLTVMFLNVDMKKIRTGIENSALLRAKLFERHVGILPQILTVNYDAHFAETRAELLRAGLVTGNAIFRNLYDHFQAADSGALESFRDRAEEQAGHENWRVITVAGTADTRVFDAQNQLLMYRKCSRQTGVLEYVNFFHNHKIWRRDSFTTCGWLSRIQFLDTATKDAIYEHYLRPDGSVALIQWFTRDGGQRQLTKIQLLNRRGSCVQEFGSQAELIAFWLRSITAEAERRYVMIVDKNRVFSEPLRALKSSPDFQNNIVVIPVIHAVHTKNAFDIKHSRTNGNYASILENLKVPDAVIVLTEKQKRDIVARYGQGNIHAIPHPYEATCQPTGFENRQRYTVVYLARYSAEKNQAMAIRAFAQVVGAVPPAKLQLYGHGSGKAALQEQVKLLGLEQSVSVNDFVQDVAAVYESAGLSILTSQGEGFSLVVLESLSHGCPVVAFDVNYGPADMIEDGDNGALVPFGNENLFAQRIIEILGTPERHQRLCEHARHSAKQFRTVVVAEKWKSLIQDVIKPPAKTEIAMNIGQTLQMAHVALKRIGFGGNFRIWFDENDESISLSLTEDFRNALTPEQLQALEDACRLLKLSIKDSPPDLDLCAIQSDAQNAETPGGGGDASETFGRYYSENKWGNSETVSGSGSTLPQTQTLRTVLPTLFSDLSVRSLLETSIGCVICHLGTESNISVPTLLNHWSNAIKNSLDRSV